MGKRRRLAQEEAARIKADLGASITYYVADPLPPGIYVAAPAEADRPWWFDVDAAQWFRKAEGESSWTEVPAPDWRLPWNLVPLEHGPNVVTGCTWLGEKAAWMAVRYEREDDAR